MKVLIIEDEPLIAKSLETMVLRLEPTAVIAGVLSSVESALKWFGEHTPPDLIISDIRLSDGISFEIFESLHLHCPVIFTTAYDEYAIRAFKLNSIDYLLKPIDEKDLEKALLKYKSFTSEAILGDQLKNLLAQWKDSGRKYKVRFLTLHRNTLVPVLEHEVAFFHKEELIYLHTLNNERFISDQQTLDEIESLVNPEKFFRVNRQYILHIQTVARIKTTHKGLTVQLKLPFNIELDISREKAAAFKKWLG
jgi:two-component system, LytTR family, response regulator